MVQWQHADDHLSDEWAHRTLRQWADRVLLVLTAAPYRVQEERTLQFQVLLVQSREAAPCSQRLAGRPGGHRQSGGHFVGASPLAVQDLVSTHRSEGEQLLPAVFEPSDHVVLFSCE